MSALAESDISFILTDDRFQYVKVVILKISLIGNLSTAVVTGVTESVF